MDLPLIKPIVKKLFPTDEIISIINKKSGGFETDGDSENVDKIDFSSLADTLINYHGGGEDTKILLKNIMNISKLVYIPVGDLIYSADE